MASNQDGPPQRGKQVEQTGIDVEESEMDGRMRLRKVVVQSSGEVTGKYRSFKDLNAGLSSAPFNRSLMDVDLGKPEDAEAPEMAPPTGTIVTSNNTFTFKSDGDVQDQRKVTVPYVQGHFPFYPVKGGEPLRVTGYMPVNSFQETNNEDPFSYEPKRSDQAGDEVSNKRRRLQNNKQSEEVDKFLHQFGEQLNAGGSEHKNQGDFDVELGQTHSIIEITCEATRTAVNSTEVLHKYGGLNFCYGKISYMPQAVDFADPGKYVNQDVIEFYVEYLRKKYTSGDRKVYIFNTILYQKMVEEDQISRLNVDVFSFDFLVFPVFGQAHWSLLIVCYPKKPFTNEQGACLVLHLDPLKEKKLHKYDHKTIIRKFLQAENQRLGGRGQFANKKFNFRSMQVPQQQNMYDCGPFSLAYLEYFLFSYPLGLKSDLLGRVGKKKQQELSELAGFQNFLQENWFESSNGSRLRKFIKYLMMNQMLQSCTAEQMQSAAYNSAKKDLKFYEQQWRNDKYITPQEAYQQQQTVNSQVTDTFQQIQQNNFIQNQVLHIPTDYIQRRQLLQQNPNFSSEKSTIDLVSVINPPQKQQRQINFSTINLVSQFQNIKDIQNDDQEVDSKNGWPKFQK